MMIESLQRSQEKSLSGKHREVSDSKFKPTIVKNSENLKCLTFISYL
jgi:hypothetical protein